MKKAVGAGFVAVAFLVVGAHARGGGSAAGAPVVDPRADEAPDWSAWTRPLGKRAATPPAETAAEPESVPLVDVVDAHWMALTMWGEARDAGEAGLRAVGHVIDNRRRAGMHGAYVTDTVGAAFQFSCWNPGDPNRDKMLNVDLLAQDSGDYRMWRLARQVADEILTGRSQDPTGGALFYHSAAVSPAWSAGIPPTRRIGSHMFFRTAR